jgi:hypothetical protein
LRLARQLSELIAERYRAEHNPSITALGRAQG